VRSITAWWCCWAPAAATAEVDVTYVVDKLVNLRIFADDDGKMNRSVLDVGGGVLVISQFTLYGDVRKGRRPAFVDALEPGPAEALYDRAVAALTRAAGWRGWRPGCSAPTCRSSWSTTAR
jgi:D-tyrosyl-tRNA(Tyr) deacylase